MARSLVIVESPAKAKTINKYLGRNYTGQGFLWPRDGLAQEDHRHTSAWAGKRQKEEEAQDQGRKHAEKKVVKPVTVTAQNIFEPTYEVIPGKIKVINDLQKAARGADAIYLAGDPDREGEAICAHLAEILGKPAEIRGPGACAKKRERRRRRLPSPPRRKKRLRPMDNARASKDLSRDV